jgi:hypothetical protein
MASTGDPRPAAALMRREYGHFLLGIRTIALHIVDENFLQPHRAPRRGTRVGILWDVTDPGVWMVHCHIADHHESGMMFSFKVAPSEGA